MICSRIHRTSWRSAAAALVLAAAGLAGAPAQAQAVPGEILVQLDSAAALTPLLQKYPLTLVGRFGSRPIFRLKAIGSASVPTLLGPLALEPGVLIAEANQEHSSPEARKNVLWAVGSAQAYAVQWAPQAMRLPQAQRLVTGLGVRVAVLDTGIDLTHPAFAGRLLPGFDFVDFDTVPAEEGTAADAGWGHGTHVAGLVALAAPQAKIMPLRVLDRAGRGNAWVLAEAILYALNPDGNPATDDGAHVINLSLGSPDRTSILGTITHLASCAPPDPTVPVLTFTDPGYNDDKARCAASAGAVVVAAAGNNGNRVREYPAAEGAYGLLPVTASASTGRLASFATNGNWIAVAAPGEGVTSALPGGLWGTWSGTSMAAPLASGVAALMRQAQPTLTPKRLVRLIERNNGALCGTDIRQIDALAALGIDDAPSRRCR